MARLRGPRIGEGKAVGQNEIHGADKFNGESERAEQTLEDAGLRPNEEMVIIQSGTLTIKDPEFRTAIEQASERLARRQVRGERRVAAGRKAVGVAATVTPR